MVDHIARQFSNGLECSIVQKLCLRNMQHEKYHRCCCCSMCRVMSPIFLEIPPSNAQILLAQLVQLKSRSEYDAHFSCPVRRSRQQQPVTGGPYERVYHGSVSSQLMPTPGPRPHHDGRGERRRVGWFPPETVYETS